MSPRKHDEPSLLDPQIMYQRRRAAFPRLAQSAPPRRVVFVLSHGVFQRAARRWGREVLGFSGQLVVDMKSGTALAGSFGVGGPALAVLMEDLIAWGVQEFVLAGLAGSLVSELASGQAVLALAALRDDGVSNHYLPAGEVVAADVELSHQLQACVPDAIAGKTWTTAAPYRETQSAVEAARGHGAVCVEMEAAAGFAVAQFRQVAAGGVFVIADRLANGRWEPPTDMKAVDSKLLAVVQACL